MPGVSKRVSGLLGTERSITLARKDFCEFREKLFTSWVSKVRRLGFEDLGDLLESTFVKYFRDEITELDARLVKIAEVADDLNCQLSQWEAEVGEEQSAKLDY